MHNPNVINHHIFADSENSSLMRHLERIDLLLQHDYYQQKARSWSGGVLLSLPEIEQRCCSPRGMPVWLEREYQHEPEIIRHHDVLTDERLGQLRDRFELTDFELDIILLGSLAHLDSRYQVLLSDIQGKGHPLPTIELALRIFCSSALERQVAETSFLPQSPLYASQLLLPDSAPPSARKVWGKNLLSTRLEVWHFLLGNRYQTASIEGFCQWQMESSEAELTPPEHKLYGVLRDAAFDTDNRAVVILRQATKRQIAHVLDALGYQTLLLETGNLPVENAEALSLCRQAIFNARLHRGGLVICSLDELQSERPVLCQQLTSLLVQASIPLICLLEKHSPLIRLPHCAQVVFTMPQLTSLERSHILGQWLDEESEIDTETLSRRFSFIEEDMPYIRQEADFYHQQYDPQSVMEQRDWHQALRYRAHQHFGNLAQRIEPKRCLDDLIISTELRQQINEISAAIRYREALLEQGFQQKIQYGTGISALFYGPSGTGKSMAAEVLAHSMQVDLIKIDLSAVVNKYIGETEKNLSRIFDLAEADAGVLFFDEADALFGKRSQVKDAQDRHANIEVSYLLQRLEHFPGLVILATNNRSHLDDAFIRRLTFITRFSYPDSALREQMWRTVWPEGVEADDDVDFVKLAECIDITGANIRNIVLLACWLAKAESEEKKCTHVVKARHIELACSRELAKAGRLKI